MLSASLSVPLSVSYYLSSLVSCSPPPTIHHHPPQNIFTLERIWYPGSLLTIPRHFLQIPLFGCLLWVAGGGGDGGGGGGCCYFYFVEAGSDQEPVLEFTKPLLTNLGEELSQPIYFVFQRWNWSLTDDNWDNSKCEKELTGLLLDSVMWPSDEQQDCQ